MSAVLEWLEELVTERCDAQVVRLLRAMLSIQPQNRPTAEAVWKRLTCITSLSKDYFCGPCCMPLSDNDPLLKADSDKDPSRTRYGSVLEVPNAHPVEDDLFFRSQYETDIQLDFRWERNLRHWDRSILDVVQSERPDLLARKRIFSPNEGPCVAENEARILRAVKHKHIVRLHSTYKQGSIYGLLFAPAADYDLRSYLTLAETHTKYKTIPQRNFSSSLTQAFGSSAEALACVHTAGFDHGDISPENILVHNERIFLSKFSFGLELENIESNYGSSRQRLWRLQDKLGKLSLGLGAVETSGLAGGQQRQKVYEPFGYARWEVLAYFCIAGPVSTARMAAHIGWTASRRRLRTRLRIPGDLYCASRKTSSELRGLSS